MLRQRSRNLDRSPGGSGPTDGFTLLELLVAVVILSVSLFGLISQATALIRGNRIADQGTAATALAQDKIEELKGVRFDLLASGADAGPIDAEGAPGGLFTRSWTVSSTTVHGVPARQIRVSVSWPDRGGAPAVQLSTLVVEVPEYGPGFPTVVERSWRRM